MDALFKTETEYTYEKYAAYCKVIANRIGHMRQMMIWTEAALLLLCMLNFVMRERKLAVFFLLAAVIFPIVLNFNIKRQTKKAWESNKTAQGIVSRFAFYEDYFEQENPVGASRVRYEDLYDIVESDDAFYLMIANNQGYIIDKSKCSEELKRFIREQKERRKEE